MNKYSLHTLEVLIISKTRTNLKESCNTLKQHTCWLQRAFHALNNLLSRVDNNSCDIFTSLRGRCNEHDIIQENNFSWLGLKSYFTKNTASLLYKKIQWSSYIMAMFFSWQLHTLKKTCPFWKPTIVLFMSLFEFIMMWISKQKHSLLSPLISFSLCESEG